MITEVVVLVVVVGAVVLWGLRSIVRSVRAGSCGGSKADEQPKCGQCSAAAKSQCPDEGSCEGGD